MSDQQYGVSKNLWARLTLPDGTPVTLIGVHFLARPDDVERRDRREAQAEVIRQLVAAEVAAGRQVIALGDFNDHDEATLDRAGSRPITDVLAIVKRAGPGPDDDLVNVLADVAQAERFTSFYDRDGDGAFDAGEFSAIDHVLLSPALYRRVVDVRYVHAHDPRAVSDHFPVVVTLSE
jgi:endonuclease/exonuclease/phosphatase family metal-dependent hydrolase